MDNLESQIQTAVESILENSRLTADLDDDAAQTLLDWGIALAKRAVTDAAVLEPEAAEQSRYTRLRATRKMMRQVNNFIASRERKPADMRAAALNNITQKAAVASGGAYLAPNETAQARFLEQYTAAPPPQFIAQLRSLLESEKPHAP